MAKDLLRFQTAVKMAKDGEKQDKWQSFRKIHDTCLQQLML